MQTIKTPSFTLAVYTAGDSNAKKLALCLPGYCDTKDYPDIRTHADLLGERGYYAVAFDPPGTWESPGEINLYTTTNYLKAIYELIEHFGSRPTLLIGKSMGGRMAQLGAQDPAVICFISVVGNPEPPLKPGYTEVEYLAGSRHISHRDLPEDPTRFRDITVPFSFVQDSFPYDARKVIGNLKMPKLYIAGQDDVLALPERMEAAFKIAADPKEFVLLPMDHDYRKDPAKLQLVNDAITQFLDKYDL